MKVSEIMSEDVEVIEGYAALDEAAELMRSANVGVLPVVESEQLMGVITDRDIVVRALAQGDDPARTTVREVMTRESVVALESDPVDAAVQLMVEHQIRRLPVLDADRRLVGIVSLGDLATQAGAEARVGAAFRAIAEK